MNERLKAFPAVHLCVELTARRIFLVSSLSTKILLKITDPSLMVARTAVRLLREDVQTTLCLAGFIGLVGLHGYSMYQYRTNGCVSPDS